MEKTKNELREEISKLEAQIELLTRRLEQTQQQIPAIQAGKVDALVVVHKQNLRIFTERTADKLHRLLIEKMREGALALTRDGVILFCNSYFAGMIGASLQRVIGSRFVDYVANSSQRSFYEFIQKGWNGYVQTEILMSYDGGVELPVFISANPLALEDGVILSIIISDLRHKNKLASRTRLVEKIIETINQIGTMPELQPRKNYSVLISEKMNHSYTYLSSIFKEAKGISIQKFIIITRIELVKELLREGDLNLTEISYKLNYSSVSHLSRQFKEITGVLPSDYRNH